MSGAREGRAPLGHTQRGAAGTVFEFLEFDWEGGSWGGHCIPGATERAGCGSDTPVHYGQAALEFYIAHPKGD